MLARLTVDDEEKQEFSQTPTHHSVTDFIAQTKKQSRLLDADISPHKSEISEENAENKHFIPKKESIHSSYHFLENKLNAQGPPDAHKKTHEVKRLKPGHGTRAMLQITYPQPHILMPPHPHNITLSFNEKQKTKTNLRDGNQDGEKVRIVESLRKMKAKEKDIPKPGSKQNELEMLKIVNKLEDLSDDEIAADIKGPILSLAKQKILEDLKGLNPSNNNGNNNKKISGENCKRNGDCKKKTKSPMATVPPAVQQLIAQSNAVFAMQQQQQPQQQQQHQQQQQSQNKIQAFTTYNIPSELSIQSLEKPESSTNLNFAGPGTNSYISNPLSIYPSFDATKILTKYPELRSSGITEAVLNTLAGRVPNLEQRIEKHFATRSKALVEQNRKVANENALRMTPEFIKKFQQYLSVPDSTHPRISQFIQGESSLKKPPGIDEHPCRRDGTCVFPESFFHKPPHALPPKPDVWIKDAFLLPTSVKDDTRLTPDHLIMQGPDPRYLEYYQSYLEGHPGIYIPTTTEMPPHHPAQLPPFSELSTTIEGLPPGSTITSESWVTTLDWTPFSVCSVTCGRGEKKRFRRCSRQDCPSGGVEIETVVCIQPDCPGECNLMVCMFC